MPPCQETSKTVQWTWTIWFHILEDLIHSNLKADPYICGHVGHATTSCAFTYSNYIERILTGGEITGDGMDTILGPM